MRLRPFAFIATALLALVTMAISPLASATERIATESGEMSSKTAASTRDARTNNTAIDNIATARSQRGDRPADGITVYALYMVKSTATPGAGRTIA